MGTRLGSAHTRATDMLPQAVRLSCDGYESPERGASAVGGAGWIRTMWRIALPQIINFLTRKSSR